MKSSRIIPVLMVLVTCGLCGCTNVVTQPDLTGSLVGYVYTFDEFARPFNDHSNVLVTAIGFKPYHTRTDKDGRFEFKGLPAGTYELHIEKEGFGTMKQFGIQHLGGRPTLLGNGSDLRAFFIYQIPTSEFTSLSIENDTLTAVIDFQIQDPGYSNMIFYFSSTGNFAPKDADYTVSSGFYGNQSVYEIPIAGLENMFETGEKVFYKSCYYFLSGVVYDRGLTIYGIDYYFDYTLDQTIQPNLSNESSEYTYIMP